MAAQLSGLVNKAYGTLLNPYTRAEYIMQLEDIHISEHESLDDPELIMEIMEAREELETAENREDVERIREENQGTTPCVQTYAANLLEQRKLTRSSLSYRPR